MTEVAASLVLALGVSALALCQSINIVLAQNERTTEALVAGALAIVEQGPKFQLIGLLALVILAAVDPSWPVVALCLLCAVALLAIGHQTRPANRYRIRLVQGAPTDPESRRGLKWLLGGEIVLAVAGIGVACVALAGLAPAS